MLIIGHNHVGGLENVGRKIRLFINLEGNGGGSTHFSRECAPWQETSTCRRGERVKSEVGGQDGPPKLLATSHHLSVPQSWPNLWITDSIPIQMCQPRPGHTGGPAGLRELTLPQCVTCGVKSEARPPKLVSEGDPSSPPTCNQQVIWTRHCSGRTVIPFICKCEVYTEPPVRSDTPEYNLQRAEKPGHWFCLTFHCASKSWYLRVRNAKLPLWICCFYVHRSEWAT